jgi:hypothetical protein
MTRITVVSKTAVGVLKIDASENASEDIPLDSLDEHDGMNKESLPLLYCTLS